MRNSQGQAYICEDTDYVAHAKEIPLVCIRRKVVRITVARDISSKEPMH